MKYPKITHAFLDMDSVAYVGACIAEKAAYQYVKTDGSEKTQVFKKAAEAKGWFVGAVAFGEIEEEEWKRETITILQDVSIAIKGVEYELANWKRDIARLTKNPDIKLVGYLTPSGIKTKDITGLENRYQYNRYLDEDEWEKKPNPTHLAACREYLLTTCDWIKMAPEGYEADAPVVYRAETMGYSAVAVSKDKDIAQCMRTNFINMNPSKPTLARHTVLGDLELIEKRSSKEVKGSGFKLLCYQTIVGDVSDGYKGLPKVGAVFGYSMFKDLPTVEACLEALISLYKTRYPEGHKYTDWCGIEQERTPEELVSQHMQLAYHERGRKDKSNPVERFLAGEEPILGGYRD